MATSTAQELAAAIALRDTAFHAYQTALQASSLSETRGASSRRHDRQDIDKLFNHWQTLCQQVQTLERRLAGRRNGPLQVYL